MSIVQFEVVFRKRKNEDSFHLLVEEFDGQFIRFCTTLLLRLNSKVVFAGVEVIRNEVESGVDSEVRAKSSRLQLYVKVARKSVHQMNIAVTVSRNFFIRALGPIQFKIISM